LTVNAFAPSLAGTPVDGKHPSFVLTAALRPKVAAVLAYHLLLAEPGCTEPSPLGGSSSRDTGVLVETVHRVGGRVCDAGAFDHACPVYRPHRTNTPPPDPTARVPSGLVALYFTLIN